LAKKPIKTSKIFEESDVFWEAAMVVIGDKGITVGQAKMMRVWEVRPGWLRNQVWRYDPKSWITYTQIKKAA
jgi:hypothetical protein